MNGLLQRAWGANPAHKCIFATKKDEVKPAQLFHDNPAVLQIASDKLSSDGWDVFYSVGLFYDGSGRKKENVAQVSSFFLDIDCGAGKPYADEKAGLAAVMAWCKKHTMPMFTDIVLSGSGLHVYWMLDEPLATQQWAETAARFKRATTVTGLHCDAVVMADPSRVLRVPGSYNHKSGEPIPVRHKVVSEARITHEQFKAALPAVGPIQAVDAPAKIATEWDVPADYPPGDAQLIAHQCQQMNMVLDKRGAVSEPFWRAALSVVERCQDKNDWIVAFSDGDPRYNASEARRKAANTAGPQSCDQFNACNPGGCTGCPHYGKVTSPIQLGVAVPKPKSPDDTRLFKLGRFTLTEHGVYEQPPVIEDMEPEKPVLICEAPIWISQVRSRGTTSSGFEEDESTVVIEWVSLDKKPKKALLYQNVLFEKQPLTTWLANHNLMGAVRDLGKFMRYISQYTTTLTKREGTVQYYDRLGWHQEGFVVGDSIVSKTGVKPALIQSDNPIKKLLAKGSADAWAAGVAPLAAPEHWRTAFSILAAFGSPLLDIASKKSAVVSLVGPSGAGKTLSAQLALSIFGDPQALTQSAGSTLNAIAEQMESANHVPYLLDEITNVKANKLSEIIYQAANSQGKSRLTRTASARSAKEWALVPFVTSNHPLLEYSEQDINEANRRRIIEVYFDQPFNAALGASLAQAMANNQGVAGHKYLQAVAGMDRDTLKTLVDQQVERLMEKYKLPGEARFGIWTLAVAVVGGSIAKTLGLIPGFDIEYIVGCVARELAVQNADALRDIDRVGPAVVNFLRENHRNILLWPENSKLDVCDDGLAMQPVARNFGDGRLAIAVGPLKQMLVENRISYKQVRGWLEEGCVEKNRKVRLSSGSSAVASMCYVFSEEYLTNHGG